MKQKRRRAACAECVIRKHLHLLIKAYLLYIILIWLGEAKPSGLIKSSLIIKLCHLHLGLFFFPPQLISDYVSCLVMLQYLMIKNILFINILVYSR